MSQVELDKIKFTTVGGDPDKEDLKKCYFYPTNPGVTPIVYAFYKKENGVDTLLASNITSGTPFSFTLGSGNWTWNIPNPATGSTPFVISGSGSTATASGSWTNNDNGTLTAGNDGNGESGTFQAQAGQTVSPEEEAASAAKA